MSKVFGGVMLIIGTSIGAGMLALPLATAAGGFWDSTLLLFICWLISTFGAFLLLEANLRLPEKTNLISMAKQTFGLPGKVFAWVVYLLLLYSLMSAYISGGTDVVHGLLNDIHISPPLYLCSFIFVILLGFVVYLGIQSVDYVNRGLMSLKLLVFALLVIAIFPFTRLTTLPIDHVKALLPAVTVAITSFGYSIIIPSLRDYFHSDVKKLRSAVLMGSLIPLVIYIIWDFSIQGVLKSAGPHGLVSISQHAQPTTQLIHGLVMNVHNSWIISFMRLFTAICMVTSFMGVSLALSDFLADGYRVKKRGKGGLLVYATTFVPPLVIILAYPSVFIACISYAGICCIALLILLPMAMAWRGRYSLKTTSAYQVLGGKPLLLFGMLVGSVILIVGVAQVLHFI
jgi:tyrosine-specific transport protein